MNNYGWIILMTLLAGYALDAVATILNMRHSPEVPPEKFKDCLDQDRFRRTRNYLVAKGQSGLIQGGWDLLLLLTFWGSGGFDLLDQWLRALIDNEILRGVVYIGVLVLAARVLNLPFAIHDTFVVENRFGFNRTTPATFIMDRIKALVLSVLLGGTILWCVLWFFQKTGPLAWLYCWASVTLFSIAVQYVAPRWIIPLFYQFKPLPDGELRHALLAYAEKVQFPVQEVYEIDGSRRSTKANAFFTGFGKNRRIALFDTLIRSHSPAEVIAVLAHEVGHFKHRHVLKGVILGTIHSGLL
ncbi:MAG: M48 family metallopeptidase, partial [Magnetococcales bacterium]|nr:M48 family metallopeptidase [Magnetococcales bacterium]